MVTRIIFVGTMQRFAFFQRFFRRWVISPQSKNFYKFLANQ